MWVVDFFFSLVLLFGLFASDQRVATPSPLFDSSRFPVSKSSAFGQVNIVLSKPSYLGGEIVQVSVAWQLRFVRR